MGVAEAVALVATSLAVPFAVQLVKGGAVKGNAARWLAVGTSLAVGAVCAAVGGVPADPGMWAQACFAAVGGTQAAYAAYKSAGVTDRWLDALAAVRVGEKVGGEDQREESEAE